MGFRKNGKKNGVEINNNTSVQVNNCPRCKSGTVFVVFSKNLPGGGIGRKYRVCNNCGAVY